MRIFDCFTYCDEDLILDLRFNILDKYIDYFVIVESKFKHNGDIKGKNFNINNFSKFKNKIKYIYLDKEPNNIQHINKEDSDKDKRRKLIHNAYARENYQRDCIDQGLNQSKDDDLIIISDVDEIPNLETINLENKNEFFLFEQKMLYYKLNLIYENFIWYGSKACRKNKLKNPQWLRNIKNKKYSKLRVDILFSEKKYSNIKFINNGGWHFTNIKKPKEIFTKMNSFLHHVDFKESGLDYEMFEKFIKEKNVFYDHSSSSKKIDRWFNKSKLQRLDLSNLPQYININKKKYKDWLD
jgi:beta-1,4-mannosyl-glycoprotein beta-1,4-N-acetylglucosaminyltransferase